MPLNQKIIRKRSKRTNSSARALSKGTEDLDDGGMHSEVGESMNAPPGQKRTDSGLEHLRDSEVSSSGDEIVHPGDDDDTSYGRPAPLDDNDTDESSLSLGIETPQTTRKSVKRKQTTKKKPATKSKAKVSRKSPGRRRTVKAADTAQEEIAKKGRSLRQQRRARSDDIKINRNDDDFDIDSDEEIKVAETKSTSKRRKKDMSANAMENDEDEQPFELPSESGGETSDDDDDYENEKSSKSTNKKKSKVKSKTTTRKAGRTKGKKIRATSDDDTDDDVKPRRKSPQSKREKKSKSRVSSPKTSTKRTDFVVDSDDEDEVPTHDASKEEERVAAIGFRRSSRRRHTPINFKEDSASDAEEYLDNRAIEAMTFTSPVSEEKRESNGTASRRRRASVQQNKVSEEDVDDIIFSTRSKRRSPRASASQAARKMAQYLKDNGNDEEQIPTNRSPKKAEDDEAFETDENSDSSEADLGDEDEDSLVDKGNVDVDASFLDAEESDDADPKQLSTLTPPSFQNIPRRPKVTNLDEEQWKSGSSDDQSDEEAGSSPSPALASPHMPFCQSTTDAITMETLPKKHICFFMPDGKTKQCFALETLHKIALSEPVMYANEKATFKQPPHFRTPMSADMEDQIASRFGRAAVNIRGHFYNPGKLEFDYTVNPEDLDYDEEFAERVNKYVNNCMGSRDVYCCPICYIEAHRRLENNEIEDARDDDSSEDETENLNLEFVADPMTILGCVDNDEFKLASAFCFGKLVQVKEHLRKDHTVDTSILDGNDLYKRFQIRAADGLLQRFLDKKKNRNHTNHRISRQGEMVSYWFNGNNELFVFLLDLMDRWRIARSENDLNSSNDDADAVVHEFRELSEKLNHFWSSFANRGNRIWEVVSEPYQKGTRQELEDFLEDGNEADQAGVAIQYHLINREIEAHPTPEEEIVSALRQSRGKESEESSYSDEEENENDGDSSEDVQLASSSDERARRYYSEESEDDEWEQELKKKRKARVKKERGRRNVKVVEVQRAKKLGGGKKRPSGLNPIAKADASRSVEASASKRRRVIQESDSD
ncbi:hypothetical protein MHU86_20195 [Fragilaria crotonensis]|nr:hypothetical protein MHU86_20195 [Fragilaria crotonensis]